MNSGITLQEINRLFDYLKESNNNSDTTILITNDMCKELYNLLLDCIEYQKIKNKEIERLNNIINELEKLLNYDIDKSEEYMNKIRRSSLQQGDYPVHYYRAEWQKEKAIGYLDKIHKLKGDGSNE